MEHFSSFMAGIAIALVGYDVIARLKVKAELTETLSKVRQTHNEQGLLIVTLQDAVNRHEMMLGGAKGKPNLGALK